MNSTRQPWRRTLWLIWAGVFIANLGFSVLVPFLPKVVQDMGVQGKAVELWSGLIFSANYITAAITLPYWGSLADRKGRRPMMIRAAFGQAVMYSLMALAHHPWQLLVLRFAVGSAVGFNPAAIAYMTTITPKEDTGYMLGTLQTASTTATILGPLFGGLLSSFMGYQVIFYVTGLSCLVAGLIAYLFVHEDFVPAVTTAKHTNPLGDLRTVVANTTLLTMVVVIGVQNLAVMNAEPIISLYLGTLRVPASLLSFLSGAVFSVVGLADVIAAPLLGRRADRIGYKKVLMICLAGVAVTYALQGAAASWWQLLVFRFAQGCFMGGILASANSLISLSAGRDFQGRAFGVSSSAAMVGNCVGPLIGAGVAAWLGYRAVFPITGLLVAANLLWVWRAVPERMPLARRAAAPELASAE